MPVRLMSYSLVCFYAITEAAGGLVCTVAYAICHCSLVELIDDDGIPAWNELRRKLLPVGSAAFSPQDSVSFSGSRLLEFRNVEAAWLTVERNRNYTAEICLGQMPLVVG